MWDRGGEASWAAGVSAAGGERRDCVWEVEQMGFPGLGCWSLEGGGRMLGLKGVGGKRKTPHLQPG